jgi:putative membrane protein
MKKTMLVTLCALIALPAFAQSTMDKAKTLGEESGVNSVIGVTPTTPDFVTDAAISDMFEIKASRLAEQRSDAPTKGFAKQMVTDHEKTSKELKALAGQASTVIPITLDSAHQKMLDELTALNGADFTKKYHSQQVSAHKDAVSLFDRYSKGGDNTALKTWAATTLPTLQHHLDMAQALDK